MKHTIEELESVLSYDPESGVFRWKHVSRGRPLRLGLTAGTNSHGYVVISYQKTFYRAHVLAWAIMTREWPTLHIDHKDGKPSNNKWTNLRQVNHAQNQWNSKCSKNNKAGHKNICWSPIFNKWHVQIMANGKRHTKYLADLNEAIEYATKLRSTIHKEHARHS